MTTNTDQRPLRGRTVLVTGGTGGKRLPDRLALARLAAQVLITGRDAGHGKAAAAAIRRQSGHEQVRFLQADHATVGGNQRLADQVRAEVSRLDDRAEVTRSGTLAVTDLPLFRASPGYSLKRRRRLTLEPG